MLLSRPTSYRWFPSIFLLLLSSLALVTILQLKSFYENTQKLNRMQEYNLFADELTEKMGKLESQVGRNDAFIHKLVLAFKKKVRIKN